MGEAARCRRPLTGIGVTWVGFWENAGLGCLSYYYNGEIVILNEWLMMCVNQKGRAKISKGTSHFGNRPVPILSVLAPLASKGTNC
jgi:hypothetical protein